MAIGLHLLRTRICYEFPAHFRSVGDSKLCSMKIRTTRDHAGQAGGGEWRGARVREMGGEV